MIIVNIKSAPVRPEEGNNRKPIERTRANCYDIMIQGYK